jgi:putative spermidine/putrescine transport system substrate-binding protein
VAGDPKFSFTYNQGLLNISYFVIPKGASDDQKLAAYRFLRELTLPQNQAEAAKIIAYSGNSPEMDRLVAADKVALLPTARDNRARQVLPNDAFWFNNTAAVSKRWQQFKLSL